MLVLFSIKCNKKIFKKRGGVLGSLKKLNIELDYNKNNKNNNKKEQQEKKEKMLSQICKIIDSETVTVRIDWDEYFMSIALLASQRSPCQRLHVGSVIVKDNRLISMGYNGFISGAPHISRIKDDHEQSIIHSEVNALSDCAKRGASLDGAKIYVTHYPCVNCFRSIAACGIKEIIYLTDYKNDPIVQLLADDSNIIIRKIVQSS
jgi:dCMP deaminase